MEKYTTKINVSLAKFKRSETGYELPALLKWTDRNSMDIKEYKNSLTVKMAD